MSAEDRSDEIVWLRRTVAEQAASLQEASRMAHRYRQLLDTAPDALVIVDQDGVIQMVNTQTERLFGWRRDELQGKSLDVLIPERFRHVHGAHVRSFSQRAHPRPMGSGLELFGRRADGSEIPVEVSLSPYRGGEGFTISAAIRDIGERKSLEQIARTAAARLESAVEGMQDAFALFDVDDRLTLCNGAFRKLVEGTVPAPLVGIRRAELFEAWFSTLAFESDAARDAFLEHRAMARGAPTSSFEVRLRDGRSLRVVDRRTAEGGTVETIWDLTQDEHRAEELREARAVAEAANAAKTDFLSSMSHELRTPLNAILGFAQLLRSDKREPLSARHAQRVDHILRGGEHLLRLIDDILDLSRIESGNVAVSLEPVAIPELLTEVLTTLEPSAARGAVTMAVEPPPRGCPLVRADRTRLVQILVNFGSNAIKYNRAQGSVRIAVSLPRDERLRVTVSDTGWGIAHDKQDKLFQPFQRAGQETGPIEGTGIGLVISKRLAEMMGGCVGFESVPDRGSEFWVELPVMLESARTAAPVTVDAALGTRTGGDRVLLYVEDNPANVAFMTDVIETIGGFVLLTAPTAEIGIELARAERPDLILMDVNLPEMSGMEAMSVLRADERTRNIPVIALTAAASERDRRAGREAGFRRYLAKPVDVAELTRTIDDVLGTA